jgi:hypothetical protein
MNVDHILPESLQSSAVELAAAIRSYGLPDNFKVDSFENWLPACGPCNTAKSASTFRPTLLVQQALDRAARKAQYAAQLCSEIVSRRSAERALRKVELAIEAGELSREDLQELFDSADRARPKARPGVMHMLVEETLRLDPRWSVVRRVDGDIVIVATPDGRSGYTTSADRPHSSFFCPHCGSLGPWQGARCMSCGYISDPDD